MTLPSRGNSASLPISEGKRHLSSGLYHFILRAAGDKMEIKAKA